MLVFSFSLKKHLQNPGIFCQSIFVLFGDLQWFIGDLIFSFSIPQTFYWKPFSIEGSKCLLILHPHSSQSILKKKLYLGLLVNHCFRWICSGVLKKRVSPILLQWLWFVSRLILVLCLRFRYWRSRVQNRYFCHMAAFDKHHLKFISSKSSTLY